MKDKYLVQYENDLKYLNAKKRKLLAELENTEERINKTQQNCREIKGRVTA